MFLEPNDTNMYANSEEIQFRRGNTNVNIAAPILDRTQESGQKSGKSENSKCNIVAWIVLGTLGVLMIGLTLFILIKTEKESREMEQELQHLKESLRNNTEIGLEADKESIEMQQELEHLKQSTRNNTQMGLETKKGSKDMQQELEHLKESLKNNTEIGLKTRRKSPFKLAHLYRAVDAKMAKRNWYKAANNYYYKVFTESVNYTTARERCVKVGAQLACKGIRNFTVSRNIYLTLCSTFYGVWVGLDDLDEEGTFVWADGVISNRGNTNWQKGEPNSYEGKEEDCGQYFRLFKSSLLNDSICSGKHPFLCEASFTDGLRPST